MRTLIALLLALTGALAAEPERILVVGTNTPADAAAVNAAIAASPEGSEVVFRGKFLLTDTIRLRAGRSYAGESRAGTVFRQADGAKLPALVASDTWLDNTTWTGSPMAIRRLTLDGNAKGNPEATTAGLVLRAWLSVAEDLHITGMGSDGLRLTSLSANGTALRNSQVNGRIADCFIEHSGRHGIYVEDPGNSVTDWIVRDNWIASSGADGLHLDNAAGWMIERNHIYGVPHHAIWAHRCFATSICDNYIEGFGETAEAGTWCGIGATLQGDAATTITGNRIFGFGGEKQEASAYRYLSLSVNYGSALASVTGNVIRGAGTPRGIGLFYGVGNKPGLTVVSSGNAVDKVARPTQFEERVVVSAGL